MHKPSKHCPITGVYLPRFLLCVLVGFAFLFGLGFVMHNHLLTGLYEETKELWRPEAQMNALFPYVLGYNFLLPLFSAFLFAKCCRTCKGMSVCFGLILGLLFAVLMSAAYIWLPISGSLALAWGADGFVSGLGLGLIYGWIYKDPAQS